MDIKEGIITAKRLIKDARYSIYIYDGHFDPKIFQDIKVVQKMMYVVRKGVCLEIICDQSARIIDDRINLMIKNRKIQLHRHKMDTGLLKRWYSDNHIEKGHYMVVDNLHTRIEMPHNLKSDIRRAELRLKDKDFAYKFTEDFMKRLYPV